MALIVLISNQKGGVGKTTTAINLATALAAVKKRVLLVDIDPQSNTTAGLGIISAQKGSSYDLLIRSKNLSEIMLKSVIPGLMVVPSNINLIGAEVELVQEPEREFILKHAFEAYNEMFDYIIVDSPPSMGILTLNGLVASDGVIAPLQCEYYAVEGIDYLVDSVRRVKASFNPKLRIFGLLLTMYDKRSTLSLSISNEVRTKFKGQVFNTVIPRNIKISESQSHGKPVLIYDVKCPGAIAYMNLAREFLEKARQNKWQ